MSDIALVFPGQGSQAVGMGRAVAESSEAARRVFEQADAALGFPLSKLCFEGPDQELQLTHNTQPAILTTSVAVLRALGEQVPAPAFVAGHSLGEYSALVAAGTLDFADAVVLVRRRGELMQAAVPIGKGAMSAVLGLGEPELSEAIVKAQSETGGVLSIANFNAPGQIVIAGDREAVVRCGELATEAGARRALPLPVSAPFHCSLMAPAREAMTPLLEETAFVDPSVPVVCNVDARPIDSGQAARDALIRQIDHPVRWVESVRYMVEHGVTRFLEIGAGSVLKGLIRRIERGVECRSVAEPEHLSAALFEDLLTEQCE